VSDGYIVFAHGSRIEPANEAVRQVSAQMAGRGSFANVEAAFLELGQPTLQGAVARLAARGVTRIIVIPYFLTLGLHMERDLPVLLREAAAAHPEVEIEMTPPLDGHPALVEILIDRARGSRTT
jgi:sirohydrochlorin ferrochelatase